MVRGGGNGWLGKKNENEELGEKNEKRERKREENYMKKGEKGLKNASFWVINFKNFRGGVFQPPPAALPAANLSVGEKRERKREENYMKNGGKRP